MIGADSQRGAAAVGSVGLMIGAFVCFGAFLYWLSQSAEPSNLQRTDAAAVADPDDPRADAQFVELGTFAENPSGYVGRVIHLADVPVSSTLGTSLVWLSLPNDVLYLARLPEDAVAGGLTLMRDQAVEVVGLVGSMTPEVLDQWVADGVVSEDDRIEAEFATSYMNAEFINTGGGMAPQDGGGQ